jgi:RND superfamily putative drug exporter
VSLAAALVRRRLVVAGSWLLLALLLVPRAARLESKLDVSGRIPGSESAAAEEAMRTRFASPFATHALLVVTGVPAPDRAPGRRVLEETVAALRSLPEVAGTYSYLERPRGAFLGQGGRGTFVVVGLRSDDGRSDRSVPALRQATESLRRRLSAEHPELRYGWTGEGPINYDLWRTATEDARRAERRTLPITLVVLVLAFGAVGAAVLPVVSGVLAVSLSLGILALLAEWTSLSILVVNVASMLGLALGIDYALLAVSRCREAAAEGRNPEEAAAEAARHAGRTISLSGLPVAIGFMALLLLPLGELRSAGVAGLVVTAVSVPLAATLLPGLLAALGPRLDRGRLFRTDAGRQYAGYRRFAQAVVERPLLVLALTLPPLGLLAAQAARLSPTIPRGHWLPAGMESAQASRALEAMGRSGVMQALRFVVTLPEDVPAVSREGWDGVRRLAEALARDPRVEAIESLRTLVLESAPPEAGRDATAAELAAVALAPAEVKRAFVSEEGDAAVLQAVLREGLDSASQVALVRDLRRLDAEALSGVPGLRMAIGGLPAFGADYEDAVRGRAGRVGGIVVLATLAALFAGFRSVFVPIKAVALNLLSVAGAFGALVVVFQDGWGVRLLGLPGPVDGVFPIVPALVFCSVFGLSMDYEVFLVARVREERRAGRAEDDAIVEGVARTGPVVTSAAAVMIAVFLAFVLGGFVLMKMLGFALAVAVLLDATVIRLAVGPALLKLAGRYNWWPG